MTNALVEFSNAFADAVELVGRVVIGVEEGGRAGVSGTIWRDSMAVTAEHTIRGYDEVTVVLPSGNKGKAKVLGQDASTDIAVLKVDGAEGRAEFADVARIKAGHLVLAVGRRGGEGLSVSHGVVSTTGGPWRTWQGGRIDHWVRSDVMPYPGFSGGPLVDASGRVLGINTSGPRRQVVTIPNATINRVIEEVRQHGRVARGYIGVGLQPVTFQEEEGERNRGLLVTTIATGSPAAKAGMMIGDVIVAVNGEATARPSDLQPVLDPDQVGKTATISVLRGGAQRDVRVTITEKNRR